MSKTKQQLIDEAVRDLSSISVTAAPKSQIRRIVKDFYFQAHTAGRKEAQQELMSGKPLCTQCPRCDEKIYVPTITSDYQLLDKAEKMSQSSSFWEDAYNNK